jgi:hypothetical protein
MGVLREQHVTSQQPDPFEMLFTARWNVPRAAEALGLPACESSWEEVKEQFRQWAVSRPFRYGSHALLEP